MLKEIFKTRFGIFRFDYAKTYEQLLFFQLFLYNLQVR